MTTRSSVLPVLLGGLLPAGCAGSSDVGNRADEPVGIAIADFAPTATSGKLGGPRDEFDLQLGELGEHASSGKMASTVLDRAGRYECFCSFHPRMTATVIAEEK